MKITFNEFLLIDLNQDRFLNFSFIFNSLNQINRELFDFESSSISFYENENPIDYLTINFVHNIKEDCLLNCYMDFAMSKYHGDIFVGFENYGENLLIERCGDSKNIYEEAFLRTKWKKVLIGNNNSIFQIRYYPINPDGKYFDNLPFGFTIKKNWFWQKIEVIKEEYYESII